MREINFLKNPEAVREKNLFEKCFGKQNISKLIKTVGSECRSRWKYYEMKTRKKKEERGEENVDEEDEEERRRRRRRSRRSRRRRRTTTAAAATTGQATKNKQARSTIAGLLPQG